MLYARVYNKEHLRTVHESDLGKAEVSEFDVAEGGDEEAAWWKEGGVEKGVDGRRGRWKEGDERKSGRKGGWMKKIMKD